MAKNRYSHNSTNKLLRGTAAMVLAGGKGTRLKGLTSMQAKPAVSFGGKYRIIDFTLSNCINSGIRRVGVLTQYMAQDLITHIQNGWGFLSPALGESISVIPAQQRTGADWYRGTADAIYQNLDIIHREGAERVLILGGDHIYKMDYSRMVNFHAETGADVTIACIQKPLAEASAFGVMELDENGCIVEFAEKPENPKPSKQDPSQALISMGIYIFNVDVLDKELREALESPDYNHDFGHNIIPTLLDRYKVAGYVFGDEGHPGDKAYWRDVGDLDQFYDANMDLLAAVPELDLYDRNWPIITRQQQRPGAKFIYDETNSCGYAINSVVGAGSIISGATVDHSLVSSNVRIESQSNVKDSVLLPGARIGKNCKLDKVIVGENCRIPDGTVIGARYEDQPEQFEPTANGVVLVNRDMFK